MAKTAKLPTAESVGIPKSSSTWTAIYEIVSASNGIAHWDIKRELRKRGINISENSVARRLREVGERIRRYGYEVKWSWLKRNEKRTRTTLYLIQPRGA